VLLSKKSLSVIDWTAIGGFFILIALTAFAFFKWKTAAASLSDPSRNLGVDGPFIFFIKETEQMRTSSPSNPLLIFIGLLISLLVGLFVYRLAGTIDARQQVEFSLVMLPQEEGGARREGVVLRIYGDYFFATPIMRATNDQPAYFENKLVIVKLSEADDNPLTIAKIGPLQMKP
jgi:hypothetical protein